MSGGPVFVAFYPDDWLAGTRGMTAAQTGVYITLTAMMYSRGEALSMDRAHLARLCGIPAGSFKKIVAVLIEHGKIIETDAGLWSRRVERELGKTTEKSAKAAASAKARWSSDQRENRTSTMHSGEQQKTSYTEEKPSDNNEPSMRTECERNANQTQTHIVEASASTLMSEKPKSEPSRFPEFWDAFADKRGRPAAEKAFAKASKKFPPGDIIDAARRYAATRKPGFGKMPQGWLNDERFNDEHTGDDHGQHHHDANGRAAGGSHGGGFPGGNRHTSPETAAAMRAIHRIRAV